METKKPQKSLGIIGNSTGIVFLAGLIVMILKKQGVETSETEITQLLTAIVAIIANIAGLYGRIRANTRISTK